MALSPTSGPRKTEGQGFRPIMNEAKFGPFNHDIATSAESSPMASPGAARTTLHRRFTSETIRPTYSQLLPATSTLSNSPAYASTSDVSCYTPLFTFRLHTFCIV